MPAPDKSDPGIAAMICGLLLILALATSPIWTHAIRQHSIASCKASGGRPYVASSTGTSMWDVTVLCDN